MTLDEGHYYIYFFAITSGKVSLWLWKSLENSEFFLLLCDHPVLENVQKCCLLTIVCLCCEQNVPKLAQKELSCEFFMVSCPELKEISFFYDLCSYILTCVIHRCLYYRQYVRGFLTECTI